MIEAHKTAISRNVPSVPARMLKELGIFRGRVLDYGCGKGIDSNYLEAARFDPYFAPEMPSGTFDTVFVNYVLNVIPEQSERIKVIQLAFSKVSEFGTLILTSRTEKEILKNVTPKWIHHKDGYITPKNTFQKGFSNDGLLELAELAIVLDTTILMPIKTSKFSVITIKKRPSLA